MNTFSGFVVGLILIAVAGLLLGAYRSGDLRLLPFLIGVGAAVVVVVGLSLGGLLERGHP